MQNYKDLKGWQKAHEFTLKIYAVTKSYPKEEIYSLINQLRRAASSIPANIAEGCGKNTKLGFAKFLNIALGSANESEYYLLLLKHLQYLQLEKFEALNKLVDEIKAILISLINKVRSAVTNS
jgi:four helix bundle protein